MLTSRIARDIANSVPNSCKFNSSLDKFNVASFEGGDLLGDEILIVCASPASDSSVYDRLKRDRESESLDLVNSEGQNVCYLFNNSQSQLWLDGARFYGFNICKKVPGNLQFSVSCFWDTCFDFTENIMTNYVTSFIECRPLVVLWLMETKIQRKCINRIFGKNDVLLNGEELNDLVATFCKLREE